MAYPEIDYYDEFGEVIGDDDAAMTDDLDTSETTVDDMAAEDLTADDSKAAPATTSTPGMEFHETLASEHIGDQLEDPNLQAEAEDDHLEGDDSSSLDDADRVKPIDDVIER